MYCAQSACLRLLCLYMCLCRGQCPESFPRWPGRAFGSRGPFSLIARRERHQRGIEPPWAGFRNQDHPDLMFSYLVIGPLPGRTTCPGCLSFVKHSPSILDRALST